MPDVPAGAGGALAPPDFGRSVNSIQGQLQVTVLALSQPRGTDYAHQIILAPRDSQTC